MARNGGRERSGNKSEKMKSLAGLVKGKVRGFVPGLGSSGV